jgi:hypothetical protein
MAKFKIQTAWIRSERAQHKREMGNPQIGMREQAERYALWLCEREGVEVYPESIQVCIVSFKVKGRAQKRAKYFKATTIEGEHLTTFYPNWNFIQPDIVDHHDDLLAVA